MKSIKIVSFSLFLVIILLISGYLALKNKNSNNSEISTKQVLIKEEPTQEPKQLPSDFNTPSITLPDLINRQFDGRDFKIGQALDSNGVYTRYYITYMSGNLKISGIMNVPDGEGPFPVIITNHGYIDPAVYINGRGLKREQDYLARQGYIVIHPDYRNHADSDKDPNAESNLRLGYVEDVINAVYAIRGADFSYMDKGNIGMLGHSMGGGVTINIMVTQPNLIKAATLFAPVNANQWENMKKYNFRRPERYQTITEHYGTPETNPQFWKNVSAVNFLNNIQTPILLHQGTNDESVPTEWSDDLNQNLKEIGKNIVYYRYKNEPHEFINAWPTVMQRTVGFFDSYLK